MVEIHAQIALPVEDACIQIGHVEADLFQQPCKESVEFIAKPAAFIDNNLVPYRFFGDVNGYVLV